MAYQPLWGVYNTPPPEYHEESHDKPPAEHVIRLSESSPIESRELSLRVRSDIQRVLAARTAILELNDCDLGDNGIAAVARMLTGCQYLGVLRLEHNNITAVGCTSVAHLIVSCPMLHTVILSNNDIRDEGATILANAISSGVALRRLELLYNGVGIVGTQSLTATVGDKVFKHVSSGIVYTAPWGLEVLL